LNVAKNTKPVGFACYFSINCKTRHALSLPNALHRPVAGCLSPRHVHPFDLPP
jgi:hypothetical protein